MPPKENPDITYSIQIDENKSVALKHIDDVVDITDTEKIEVATLDDMVIHNRYGRISFNYPISQFIFLRICQISFSNNWLKMHGYPMRRKLRK